MEDKKIVALSKVKEDNYIRKSLEALGLDTDDIIDYSQDILLEDGREGLRKFFKEREEIHDFLSKKLLSKFEHPDESLAFFSVICEHMQQLLTPDRDMFYKLMLANSKEEAEKSLAEFDFWIEFVGKFEDFQKKAMATYMRNEIRKKYKD